MLRLLLPAENESGSIQSRAKINRSCDGDDGGGSGSRATLCGVAGSNNYTAAAAAAEAAEAEAAAASLASRSHLPELRTAIELPLGPPPCWPHPCAQICSAIRSPHTSRATRAAAARRFRPSRSHPSRSFLSRSHPSRSLPSRTHPSRSLPSRTRRPRPGGPCDAGRREGRGKRGVTGRGSTAKIPS